MISIISTSSFHPLPMLSSDPFRFVRAVDIFFILQIGRCCTTARASARSGMYSALRSGQICANQKFIGRTNIVSRTSSAAAAFDFALVRFIPQSGQSRSVACDYVVARPVPTLEVYLE